MCILGEGLQVKPFAAPGAWSGQEWQQAALPALLPAWERAWCSELLGT